MTPRARSLSLLMAAPLVAASGIAHAQGQPPPTVTYGAPPAGSPPPTYYSPPALPQQPPPPSPPPARGATPNAYPVSPRDYGAGPDTLGFRDGMFIPPGYHLSTRPHRAMLVTGLSLIGTAYLLGLTAGVIDGFSNQKGWLALPIAGPWITSSQRRGCTDPSVIGCKATDSSATVLLVTDGVVQAAGAATMLLAVAFQEKVLVRNDARVFVAPSAVAGGAGLMLMGRF